MPAPAITVRTALMMTLPPALWAANAVVGRLLVGRVPPLTLNFVRWLLAGLILLPIGHRALARPRAVLRGWPYWLLAGSLGVGTYNALQYLALETSTPINVTLIASGMPASMIAIGALFFGEKPNGRQVAGALLSIAGVLLVVARGVPRALLAVELVRGDLYVVAAVIAWSFYSWLLVRPPARLTRGPLPVLGWAELLLLQVLFGLIGAGIASAAEQLGGSASFEVSRYVLALIAFIAVGPAVIAYRCWGLGVTRGGPALAALFSNLTPLFAALLSATLLGERPHWFHGVASALILLGITVTSRAATREAARGATPTRDETEAQ